MFGLATGAVSFVDLAHGHVLPGTGNTGVAVQDVDFSPTGRVAISSDEAGHVTVWNPRRATVVDTFTGHEDRVLGATFSADGRTLYTCSLDGAIFAWDLSGARRFGHPFALPALNTEATINVPPDDPIATSSDSKEFATRLSALKIGVFSISSLRREATITVPAKPGNSVQTIAWSPRSPLLAVTSSDGTLGLWNMAHTPRLIRTLRGSPNPKAPLWGTAVFSPDGTRVLEGGFVQTSQTAYAAAAAMWRVSDGKLLWRAVPPNWSTDSVAISQDGRLAALSQELPNRTNRTQIVDAATGIVERTVLPEGLGPLKDVVSLGFSSDGRLETGTIGGIVQSWSDQTGKELGQPLLALPAPVASIAFQPHTDIFASGGGSGGFVKLWDAQTLQQIGSALPGSPGRWANSAFTPDGSHLVTIYDDGRGAVWPVTVAAWAERACQVAGRNFTQEEWSRFVGGRSYSRVCPQFPAGS